MSEDNQSSVPAENGQPEGATTTKRRRRRRRKPDAGSAAEKKPAVSSVPTEEKPRDGKRRRRNRGQRPNDRKPPTSSNRIDEESTREERPGQDNAAPKNKRRRRSRRKPSDQLSGQPPIAQTSRKSTPQQGESTSDTTSATEHDVPEAVRHSAPITRWGDDSDAPTPDITLASKLPVETDRGDLDPTSAYLLRESSTFDGAISGRISNIISVRFATAGRLYLYDAGDGHYARGDQVVVESDRGERVATVATASRRSPPPRTLKKIIGRAPVESANEREANAEKNRVLLIEAKAEAKTLKLGVKVFRATLEDGGKKLAVYYSCETKTDVRRLSRALSNRYPYRIDLRHTGVRDEAKLVGGIGSCGQELCCSTWLPAFVPVSIKNAKDQGLVLNPTKVSGQCGRLKCCLVYEQQHYSELRKGLPKLGKRVITHDGFEGRVVEVDVLHQRIRVGIGRGESKVYGKDEITPMFASQPTGPSKKNKKKPAKELPETSSTPETTSKTTTKEDESHDNN